MSMAHTDAVFFEGDEAFETWLVENASTATHVWIRMAKKGTGVTSIDWTTAVGKHSPGLRSVACGGCV